MARGSCLLLGICGLMNTVGGVYMGADKDAGNLCEGAGQS